VENSESCVFCRIVRGKIPASMVYQDDLTLAFMDIGSVNPGHVLVASRAHVENLYAVDDDLAAALMLTATREQPGSPAPPRRCFSRKAYVYSRRMKQSAGKPFFTCTFTCCRAGKLTA